MLDRRFHAFRPDLADIRLKNQIAAAGYAEGEAATVMSALAGVHRHPRADAALDTQALHGETARVFERRDGWCWAQLDRDGYVGYLRESDLASGQVPATHRIATPRSFIYPSTSIKTQPVRPLTLGSRIAVAAEEGGFLALAGGGHVFARHAVGLDIVEPDFVTVAERFLHAPYLWGGKSIDGIDCSGLVQLALLAAGISAPRDSDVQAASLGRLLDADERRALRRGDLVFWTGHVGIMVDAERLLHANGHAMQVTIEPLAAAVARTSRPITAVRRL